MQVKNTVRQLSVCLLFCGCCIAGSGQAPAGNSFEAGRAKSLAEWYLWLKPGPPATVFRKGLWKSRLPEAAIVPAPLPEAPQTAPDWHAQNWSANELPFFCRVEYRLGKRTHVPFKFRLGSVEYVDWLEGKPGCATFTP